MMGKYINVNSSGETMPLKGKVSALLLDGAMVLGEPSYQEDLVCVVDNLQFDAALYVSSQREYDHCVKPDGRNKTWLIYGYAKQTSK